MRNTDLPHMDHCPNYARSKDPTLCVCEPFDEIRGLEEIQKYLELMFENNQKPELFDWAEVMGDFDDEC